MDSGMITISTSEYKELTEAKVRLEILRDAALKDKYIGQMDVQLYLGILSNVGECDAAD